MSLPSTGEEMLELIRKASAGQLPSSDKEPPSAAHQVRRVRAALSADDQAKFDVRLGEALMVLLSEAAAIYPPKPVDADSLKVIVNLLPETKLIRGTVSGLRALAESGAWKAIKDDNHDAGLVLLSIYTQLGGVATDELWLKAIDILGTDVVSLALCASARAGFDHLIAVLRVAPLDDLEGILKVNLPTLAQATGSLDELQSGFQSAALAEVDFPDEVVTAMSRALVSWGQPALQHVPTGPEIEF